MTGSAAAPVAGSARATLRRGLQISPELTAGLMRTMVLALAATAGRLVTPIVVQRVIDDGIAGPRGARPALVLQYALVAAVAVIVTGAASYAMNMRLFRASEAGLLTLRTTAFRHIHDLSMLTTSEHRRGSLVSRVTSDVDTVSLFVQRGGITLLMSALQLTMATVLMVAYSPLLAGVVWLCFVPVFLLMRHFQAMIGRAYTRVRSAVGDLLSAVSESVAGAATIRAYGVQERTARRVDAAVEVHRVASISAQQRSVAAYALGQTVAGLTTAVVIVVGTVQAAAGRLTIGELTAFLFIVQLFTNPVMQATDMLNELQNAVAGWRRVIGIVETPTDIADPGAAGVELPRGPVSVELAGVSFAYPGGPEVLHQVSEKIPAGRRVAVVGETGSGKSTLAKLLCRLVDPGEGQVLLDGIDLRRVRFDSLRRRVVLVPQEGFLFDATLATNIAFSVPGAGTGQVRDVLDRLGLTDWVDTLPHGLDTVVGQRGESLSMGERQLVALARAALVDPDLLLLDEATSAVDPRTELRLHRAVDELTAGRTSITIAHRLTTAQAADEVLVVDAGRVVERGSHAELLAGDGRYARMYASWVVQAARPTPAG